MGQKNERDGMDPSLALQGGKPTTAQNFPEANMRQEKPTTSGKTSKKNFIPNLADQINLTNSMIVSESTDPNENYKKLNCIGESEGSAVYRVQNNYTEEIRAMKIIKKSPANAKSETMSENEKKEENEISDEIKVLRSLDHPNIIKIFEFFSSKDSYTIVTEFCSGGDLFQEIVDKGPFEEKYCAFVLYQILSAINHCHANHIIHRDLKPENVLIVDKDKNDFPRIKICDFGTSQIFEKGKAQRKTLGSPYYLAPEIYGKNYNEKCDLWSCGIILYILLSARPPFGGEEDEEIIESVQSGRYDLESPPFNNLSYNCLDLLKKLLTIEPNQRISAQEALEHKWFKAQNSKELFNTIKHQKTIKQLIQNLKSYKRNSIIQEIALAYLVHNFPQMKEVITANKLFNQLDTDGDGKINKNDLLKGLRAKIDSKTLEKDVDRIYKNIDMDNNGYIEYEEFVRAAVSKEKFVEDQNLRFAFRYFDKDNSGEVSRNELEAIFKQGIMDQNKMQEALDQIIDEVDENHDGIIQYSEFVHIMKKMLN